MRKSGNRALFEAQPQEALQVLNIILSYSANLNPKFVNLGRRFFQPDTVLNLATFNEFNVARNFPMSFFISLSSWKRKQTSPKS